MRLRHLALPAAAGLSLLAIPFAPAAVARPATCATPDNPCIEKFDTTGGLQTFVVPDGVTTLDVALAGAAGGDGLTATGGSALGGAGGAFEALVSVTPGDTLTLVVGGQGGNAKIAADGQPAPSAAPGGYGGGGAGTLATNATLAGGGGGSFLFNGAGQLLLAAGGGGGGGIGGTDAANSADGGPGGTSGAGAAGTGPHGGGGATTTGGGTPGAGDSGVGGSGPATGPSSFGNGGSAAAPCAAGGGGGGYFGGGSGACAYEVQQTSATRAAVSTQAVTPAAAGDIIAAGGGGGGAGFVGAGASQVTEYGDQASVADGVIAIGYTTSPTTTTLSTERTTLAPGQETNLRATVTGGPTTITAPGEAGGKVAAAAFGAGVKALAVPTQPAPAGTTVTPGTACGTTPCTVTFFVNGTQLGQPINVDPATGVATVVFTAGSQQGARSITARYDGNLYYLQSTSNAVTIDVAGLANTGVENIAPMLGSAAALLVVGAGLVAYGRRRPQLGAHRAA